MSKNFLFPNETANSRLPPNYNTNWPPRPARPTLWTCLFSLCAGAGNRTRTQSLARTSSTIKLRPHLRRIIIHKKTKYENLKFRKQFDNPYITDENESLDYLNNPG